MLFDIRFEVKYFDLKPSHICFDLDNRASAFASTTNLESGPCFVKICIQLVLLLPFSKTDGQTSFGTSLNLQWRPSTKESHL